MNSSATQFNHPLTAQLTEVKADQLEQPFKHGHCFTEHHSEIQFSNEGFTQKTIHGFRLLLTSACCPSRTQQDVQMLTHLSSCPILLTVQSGDDASELGFISFTKLLL